MFILLAILGSAVFASIFSATYTLADNFLLLTSVSRTPNPFAYFVGDWGMDSNFYRPLLSLSFWIIYRLFDVWLFPNQVLSFVSHLGVIALLLKIVRRFQPDKTVAFLFCAMSLVSMYTAVSVTLLTDRCTIFVALALLAALDHIVEQEQRQRPFNAAYVTALSALALMSKESGVVVLGLVFFANLKPEKSFVRSKSVFVCMAALALCYFALRLTIFGPKAAAYPPDVNLLGVYHYDSPDQLPPLMRWMPFVDNIGKNILGLAFPLFGSKGELQERLVRRLPIFFAVLPLLALALRRPFNRIQVLAIAIIVGNALVHMASFRYRTMYLGQIAFCILIACSPHAISIAGTRRNVLNAATTIILLFNMLFVVAMIRNELATERRELNVERLQHLIPLIEEGRIDQAIVQRVIDRYVVSAPHQ